MSDIHDQRDIGRLEGKLETITGMVTRVLDNQDRANADLEAHASEDRRYFAEVKEALGTHRDRLTKIEGIAGAVDYQGDAILTLEKRMADAEGKASAAAAVRANNLRWIGAAGAAGALAGSAGTSTLPKIWSLIVGIFKP